MKNEDLIEKYIQDKLSSEDRLVFEALLKNDISFKKEVEYHKDLKIVVEETEDSNFTNLIYSIEKEDKNQSKKTSMYKWLAAASVILLVGLTYFVNLEKNTSSKDLFSNYFKPYRNIIKPIERDSNELDETAKAFMAYERGDYNKAIKGFTQLYDKNKESYLLFYKANALLKMEKSKEAVPLLIEHLKSKDTLIEKTNWYLALAYLQMNDKQNAKMMLKTVVDKGGFKRNEAKKLLKELD